MSAQLPNSGLYGQFETNEQDWGDRANANWLILDQMAAPAIDIGITAANDSNVVQVPGTPHLMIADNADHGQIWIFTNTSTSGGATTNAFIRISPAPGRRIVFQGVSLIWDTTTNTGRWRPAPALGNQFITSGTEVVDCERVQSVLLNLTGNATVSFENYRRGQVLDVGIKPNGFTLTSSNLSSAMSATAFTDQLLRVMFTENASSNPAEPFLIVG